MYPSVQNKASLTILWPKFLAIVEFKTEEKVLLDFDTFFLTEKL